MQRKYYDLKLEIGDEKVKENVGKATLAFEYANGRYVEGREVTVICGKKGTWEINYQAGKVSIKEGGSIAVAKASWSGFQFDYRPQDFNPQARAYTSLESNTKAKLKLFVNTDNPSHRRPIAKILVEKGEFKEGDNFKLRIGDRRFGSDGVVVDSKIWRECKILVGVDLTGKGEYRQIKESPLFINTIPSEVPQKYMIIAPSIVNKKEKFNFNILAFDENNNLVKEGSSVIDLFSDSRVVNLPSQYVFQKGKGYATIKRTKINFQGIYRIRIEDRKKCISSVSNPIVCTNNSKEKIYWGDLHAHAYDAQEIKDLTPTTHPAQSYQYARDITGLDFCSLASHIFSPEYDKIWWPIARKEARKYNQPGRFITFLGAEWRGAPGQGGDRNIIHKTEEGALPDSTASLEEIYQQFEKDPDTIMVPHVGGIIADWDHYNEKLEIFCEVTSGHGNFEWFAQDALSRGYKVALIGSSDGHSGTPGHPRSLTSSGGGRFFGILNRRDSGYGGGPLIATYAEELNRDSLWAAFKKRRVYATTGARILLDFSINGNKMGSQIEVKSPPVLEISVIGTKEIMRVDIIRNQSLINSVNGGKKKMVISFRDKYIPEGESYYYVRVIQSDMEYAWSSPIWVKNKMPLGKIKKKKFPAWNKDEESLPSSLSPEDAKSYQKDLVNYLKREEDIKKYEYIEPAGMVDAFYGRYALFLAYDSQRKKRISIKWFFEFEIPRIRFEVGYLDYGKEPVGGDMNVLQV